MNPLNYPRCTDPDQLGTRGREIVAGVHIHYLHFSGPHILVWNYWEMGRDELEFKQTCTLCKARRRFACLSTDHKELIVMDLSVDACLNSLTG